MEFKVLLKNAL